MIWDFDLPSPTAFTQDPLTQLLIQLNTENPGMLAITFNGEWEAAGFDVHVTEPRGVPEPGTLGLLALGFCGIALARRRLTV